MVTYARQDVQCHKDIQMSSGWTLASLACIGFQGATALNSYSGTQPASAVDGKAETVWVSMPSTNPFWQAGRSLTPVSAYTGVYISEHFCNVFVSDEYAIR